jgi:hypothetical protein
MTRITKVPTGYSLRRNSGQIHKCPSLDIVVCVISMQRPSCQPASELRYDSDGRPLYSRRNRDRYQYICVIVLIGRVPQYPIWSDNFLGRSEMAIDFYRTQYQEHKNHESVFVMEGHGESAAWKRAVPARAGLRGIGRSGIEFIECGILFSQMQDRDHTEMELCTSKSGGPLRCGRMSSACRRS